VIVEAQVCIEGTKTAVWTAITDIENAAGIIGGIKGIEIVEKPRTGLVGLRWRETRMLFDKPTTVEKHVTQALRNKFYETRAESDGFVFLTTFRISEIAGGVTLTSAHGTEPRTLAAKLQTIPMALFFKGTIRKHILRDLNDIKAAVERK